MENKTEEIGLSWKGKNQSFVVAGIFILGTLILTAMSKTLVLMPLILGVVFIIIGFLKMNIKTFTFFEKHFVFQVGMNKKLILNKELESYDIQKRKIIINYKKNGELKKVMFLKEIITDEDVTFLKKKLDRLLHK
ncbi:hypothetical protein H0I23_12955 [Cellulophaga sp. HaHaR_3_176]|uniref:hypothetical protein n=1 Tax=Cellulophaga sp. HaHaR_3_176 TaxID=1942464 RepID=UPI001C1F9252|nr:hypothetical protein [Cellulophaga sp. HaHaR_3_176]QWX83355.1 hypothetical protein H0I23_12955 [Cellulophaga sp. HaHaR_3_176]